MKKRIINIPKQTIIKAVMGNGDYKDKKEDFSFTDEKKRKTYYFTTGRLTRAQIFVLLELHRLVDGLGYGKYLEIRDIATSTRLSMQCVNKCIRDLEKKGFIEVGVKGYGYVNVYINIKQGFEKESNTGGYYQMDSTLLDYLLSLKKIDEVRLALIAILEDDFSRVKGQTTSLSMRSVRKIVPSSAYPKALMSFFQNEDEPPCIIKMKENRVLFRLLDEYYGKYTAEAFKESAKRLIEEFKRDNVLRNKADEEDVSQLCHEYGYSFVKQAIMSFDSAMRKEEIPLGIYLRQILVNF